MHCTREPLIAAFFLALPAIASAHSAAAARSSAR